MTPAEVIALRKALGLTQVVFGRMVGVDQVTVCRWEKGKSPPTGTPFIVLCALKHGLDHHPTAMKALVDDVVWRGGGLGMILDRLIDGACVKPSTNARRRG